MLVNNGRPSAVVRVVCFTESPNHRFEAAFLYLWGRLSSVYPFSKPYSCENLQDFFVCPLEMILDQYLSKAYSRKKIKKSQIHVRTSFNESKKGLVRHDDTMSTH